MPGSGEAITMYYVMAAGPRAVLERYLPGSMLVSADFVRCRSGLELGFWRFFSHLYSPSHIHSRKLTNLTTDIISSCPVLISWKMVFANDILKCYSRSLQVT